jgi:nicotinamidase-related amidase
VIRLDRENVALLIIDVQGKLAQHMHEKTRLFENLTKLIRGVQVLEVPVIWIEQVPEKLGATIGEVKMLLDGLTPIEKNSFSCCRNSEFMKKLESLDRKQILVAGIETHVCVCQTVCDLIDLEYDAHVVADAVSSRTIENKRIGLEKMRAAGADITSVETLLFELLGIAQGEQFRAINRIIK